MPEGDSRKRPLAPLTGPPPPLAGSSARAGLPAAYRLCRRTHVERIRIWLVVVAVTGLMSSALAASLVWLLVTQPVRMGELFSRAF